MNAQDQSTKPLADSTNNSVAQAQAAPIVGLYSFPRSGNTWLRHIVAVAFKARGEFLQRYVPDMHYGPVPANALVHNGQEYFFYKSHHKQIVAEHRGQPLRTDKVIYIYRHPLDVFISYLNFASKNVNSKMGEFLQFEIESVDKLTPEQLASLFSVFTVYGTITPQNRVYGGYFEHVAAAFALRKSGFPIHIVRYENLLNDFVAEAGKMFAFLGIDDLDLNAIHQEADRRTAQDGKFFWRRKSGNYNEFLSKEQIDSYYKMFGTKLAELGYTREG